MTRRLLILATVMTLGIGTMATAGTKETKDTTNSPTTAPAPVQIKRCCVDDKGHYHPEWARGINCPHQHKYCR